MSTLIATVGATWSGTGAQALTSVTTSADDLLVVEWVGHGSNPSISDTKTLTWTRTTPHADIPSSTKYHCAFYATVPSANAGATVVSVTGGATGSQFAQMIQARPTAGNTFAYDTGAEAGVASGTTVASSAVTAAAAGDLVVMGVARNVEANSTFTASTNLTAISLDGASKTGGQAQGSASMCLAYNLAGTTGSKAYTVTMTNATGSGYDLLLFKLVSGNVTAAAGLATGTGTAYAAKANATVQADHGDGTGAALAPTLTAKALAGVATGTGAALAPSVTMDSPIVRQGSTANGNNASGTTWDLFPTNVAAGNAVLIFVQVWSGNTITAISSGMGTLRLLGSTAGSQYAYLIDSASAAKDLTVTSSGGAGWNAYAVELHGLDTTGVTAAGQATGTSATPDIGTVATTAGQYVFTYLLANPAITGRAAAWSSYNYGPFSWIYSADVGIIRATGASVTGTWAITSSDWWRFLYVVMPVTAGDVTAHAGVATATGAALAPSVGSRTPAGIATGAGAAYAPTVVVKPQAGLATATGVAWSTDFRYVQAGVATGAGAAFGVSASTKFSAGVATGTGAANDPTRAVVAQAGAGTGTGAAPAPASVVLPQAGLAAATGTALAPSIATKATAGLAAGTGAAAGASASAARGAGLATATGSALAPTVGIVAKAGLATMGGTAYAPVVVTDQGLTVQAGLATGTAQAYSASVGITARAGVAQATGAALSATIAAVAKAGLAAATGAALAAGARVTGTPPAATGTGQGWAPAMGARATAGTAAATGAAYAARAGLGAALGSAEGAGAAHQAFVTAHALAQTAQGAGQALDATAGIQMTAGAAEASGSAWSPVITLTHEIFRGLVTITWRTAYGIALMARQVGRVAIGEPRVVAPMAPQERRPSVAIQSRQAYLCQVTVKLSGGGEMADEVVEGNLVDLFASFTAAAADDGPGVPAEPTAVTFAWVSAGEESKFATYEDATEPFPGVVWHVQPEDAEDTTGQYGFRLDTTGLVGRLEYAFTGTGDVQAVGTGSLVILPNPAERDEDD